MAAHTDGLGAVINFAGLLDLGPLMEVCEERLRRVFDVNVIQTHRVNGAIFDLVRAGGGRIVNISFESGRFRAGITTKRTSAREEKHARDPKILARAVYRAVTSRRPKPRYLVNAGMQSRIMDILPGTVADPLVKLGTDLRSRVPSSA